MSRNKKLREAYEQIKQIDEPIDQATRLNEILEGEKKTPGNKALVNAVAINLAKEL